MPNSIQGAGGVPPRRLLNQFNRTVTALADISELALDVIAGKPYAFEATLHLSFTAAGGFKVAMGGSCTATSIIYDIMPLANNASIPFFTRAQALGVAGGGNNAAWTSAFVKVRGTIVVNAGGTLVPRLGQNVQSGTTSVLPGSTFARWEVM